MHQGYIKLWRKLQKWEWYKNSHAVHLLIHLILSANHKASRFASYEIKRGQVVTGRLMLASQTGMSVQAVRTALTKLKSTSEITIKTTNRFSIITICKYETYQEPPSEINQQNDQPLNQQTTNKQPTNNHV